MRVRLRSHAASSLSATDQPDLFDAGPIHLGLRMRLARRDWPEAGRLPVNHEGSRVHDQLWPDLVLSRSPLVGAGYASIENVVALISRVG